MQSCSCADLDSSTIILLLQLVHVVIIRCAAGTRDWLSCAIQGCLLLLEVPQHTAGCIIAHLPQDVCPSMDHFSKPAFTCMHGSMITPFSYMHLRCKYSARFSLDSPFRSCGAHLHRHCAQVIRKGSSEWPCLTSRRHASGRLQGQHAIDGLIETVLIPVATNGKQRPRTTLCVSSQVGCAMNCQFCFTGKMGLRCVFASE